MKRSRINRKKGLRPGKPLQRKSRMNPVSKKRAKRNRETQPERNARALERPCALCGRWSDDRVEHEIARGGLRKTALDKPFAKLVLCNRCHLGQIHGDVGRPGWPVPKQLCLKQLRDPDEYDLDAYNALAIRRVGQAEVDKFRTELGGSHEYQG